VLQRSEATVRQLVRRARAHVDARQPRFQADRGTHAEVVRRFLAACQSADVDVLMDLLAPDVVMVSDSGGFAKAPRRAVNGSPKVARLLAGISTRVTEGAVFSLETFNGELGVVARLQGRAIAAMAVTSSGDSIQSLLLVANPEKLLPLDEGREVAIR
jgi:RNA polymerase sigma-70 factor (ECF subfamily)